jgi:hypothetical protein
MLRFEVVVTKLGDKMLQQSLDEICETQHTFRLRDAFRVLAWQVLETNPEIYNDLNLRYSRFYQKWNCSKIPRMNLQELEQLAIERGFSVEGLLFYRECYYSIAHYPQEIFLKD